MKKNDMQFRICKGFTYAQGFSIFPKSSARSPEIQAGTFRYHPFTVSGIHKNPPGMDVQNMKESSVKPAQVRLYPEYPASLWLLGLLLLLKAVFWLFANPLIEEPVLGIKHILTTLPFLILWRAVWNRKTWAIRAALILAFVDLLFFIIVFPRAALIPFDVALLETQTAQGLSWILLSVLNLLILLCSSMIGYAVNLMVLLTGFFALRKNQEAGI